MNSKFETFAALTVLSVVGTGLFYLTWDLALYRLSVLEDAIENYSTYIKDFRASAQRRQMANSYNSSEASQRALRAIQQELERHPIVSAVQGFTDTQRVSATAIVGIPTRDTQRLDASVIYDACYLSDVATKPLDDVQYNMAEIGFQRLAVIFANLTAATAATLTLLGVLDSNIILGGAILAVIILTSFQLGVQYRGHNQA